MTDDLVAWLRQYVDGTRGHTPGRVTITLPSDPAAADELREAVTALGDADVVLLDPSRELVGQQALEL